MFDWRQEAEIRASRFGSERIRAAIESLSAAYRLGQPTLAPRLEEDLLVAAYLAVRFPATLAANQAVCGFVQDALAYRLPEENFTPDSLLDLGAGCGAATLAATAYWPSLTAITAIEPIRGMTELGREILPEAIWRTARFAELDEFPPHDLVLASYALGEAPSLSEVLAKAWQAAQRLLLIVEPGTPRGFATIHAAREWLTSKGAAMLAPCPTNASCPARDVDWCHFPARLNRSALHRRLKGGTLGYEDEKFSYLAAWRGDLPAGAPRVLRHPLIEPGRIEFELCNAPSRYKQIVSRRDKTAFRQARKTIWGSTLPG